MLVFNYRFFLLNMLIWSIFMLGIKIRTVLKSELNGLHKNVQHFDPSFLGSRENTKNKVQTVLMDTLYIFLPCLIVSACLQRGGLLPPLQV